MNEFRRQRVPKSCRLPIVVDLSCNALPKATFTKSRNESKSVVQRTVAGPYFSGFGGTDPRKQSDEIGEGRITVNVANYKANYPISAVKLSMCTWLEFWIYAAVNSEMFNNLPMAARFGLEKLVGVSCGEYSVVAAISLTN